MTDPWWRRSVGTGTAPAAVPPSPKPSPRKTPATTTTVGRPTKRARLAAADRHNQKQLSVADGTGRLSLSTPVRTVVGMVAPSRRDLPGATSRDVAPPTGPLDDDAVWEACAALVLGADGATRLRARWKPSPVTSADRRSQASDRWERWVLL